LSQPKLCDYVCRFLSPGSAGNRQIWASQSGQSKPGLTLRNLQNFWVALPSTECERRAIEKALSNVDGLLTGLDRLIMKKRDLKRAAMQQLLTGQTRLPSFRRGWKPKKLAELLQYQRPDEFVVKSDNYFEKGETAVLTANKSFILGYTNEKFGVYDNPPAIIFDDFTCDSKYVDFDFKVKSSAVKILTPRNVDASLRFIYEQMRLIRFRIGEHKRYYISEYQHIDLLIPEFEEQIAIAEVLRDMDAEIAALEQRREKTHLLKQAMMQELLTGKTRLI
jgi:type I restriction enzyme S subunit